jgi:effector-binding domain-containing protein
MNSIEWLIEQFNLQAYTPHIEQAKEIHMVETLLFAKKYNEYISKGGIDTMEEYYKEMFETFKKK